jgi:uncharacterized protein (TIGR03066 family)
MKERILLLVGMGLASCGGESAPTAETQLAVHDKLIVGHWIIDQAEEGIHEDLYMKPDGKMTQVWIKKGGRPRTVEGTYEVHGNSLVMNTPTEPTQVTENTIEFTDHGKNLLLPALEPEGAHQGFVGKWVVEWRNCKKDKKAKPDAAPKCLTFTYRMTFTKGGDLFQDWEDGKLPDSRWKLVTDRHVLVTDQEGVQYPVRMFGQSKHTRISSWVLHRAPAEP